MHNILISGVGGPTPIGIANSLRHALKKESFRLIGIDGNRFAPGLYRKDLFDSTYYVPLAKADNYWYEIQSIIQKEKIDFAFIVPETEVLEWSTKQKLSDLPCKSLIPDREVLNVLYDKFKTFNLLKKTDLVPDTLRVDKNEGLDQPAKKLGYPYWVRAASGAGALGSLKISHEDDLNKWIQLNPKIDNYIACEFMPGKNYATKVLFNNGQLVKSASAERTAYLMSAVAPSGISGMSSHGKLINRSDLTKKSVQALKLIFESFNLKAHGMFTVDFKEDVHGNPKITEINMRHISFNYAFTLGGINFPLETLNMMFADEKLKASKVQESVEHQFEKNYHFIRGVDSELFILSEDELLH